MQRQDWLELVLLSILWGLTYFLVAIAVGEIPPLTLVLARCLLATAILVPIVWLLGHRLPSNLRHWWPFAVMGILNNIIPFSLVFFAQQYIASALAAVINSATPLMTLLVARLVAGEPMAGHKLTGVLVGLAGVAVLMGPDIAGFDGIVAIAMLATLGGTLSYGFSGLWGRRFKDNPPIVTAASQLAMSSLMLLPIAATADRFWELPLPSYPALGAVLGLAVLSTAMAYILFFRIMARAGSNNVMLVTLLIPVTSIALGILILGENLAANQIAGALIIGLSLLVIDGRLFGIAPKR